jgi:hypothetical protein
MFVEKIYKMQHLGVSGTPVLYIGRTVLKVWGKSIAIPLLTFWTFVACYRESFTLILRPVDSWVPTCLRSVSQSKKRALLGIHEPGGTALFVALCLPVHVLTSQKTWIVVGVFVIYSGSCSQNFYSWFRNEIGSPQGNGQSHVTTKTDSLPSYVFLCFIEKGLGGGGGRNK